MRETEVRALRASVALSAMDHVAAVRVRGGGAFEAVDHLVSGDLFVRDGRMLHTLMLDEGGRPIADLYVCADDDELILLLEGLSAAELRAHAETHLPRGLDARFDDLGETHRILSLNGPYAWELVAGWMGADIIGLP